MREFHFCFGLKMLLFFFWFVCFGLFVCFVFFLSKRLPPIDSCSMECLERTRQENNALTVPIYYLTPPKRHCVETIKSTVFSLCASRAANVIVPPPQKKD